MTTSKIKQSKRCDPHRKWLHRETKDSDLNFCCKDTSNTEDTNHDAIFWGCLHRQKHSSLGRKHALTTSFDSKWGLCCCLVLTSGHLTWPLNFPWNQSVCHFTIKQFIALTFSFTSFLNSSVCCNEIVHCDVRSDTVFSSFAVLSFSFASSSSTCTIINDGHKYIKWTLITTVIFWNAYPTFFCCLCISSIFFECSCVWVWSVASSCWSRVW